MIPSFSATVTNGKLSLANRPEVLRYVQTLQGDVTVVIEKVKKNRSIQQNRYLFGVCYKLISEHTGFSTEECHQIFKKMFLSYSKKSKITGKEKVFIRSTTSLKTDAMDAYIEEVKQFASMELQIFIPDPTQVKY